MPAADLATYVRRLAKIPGTALADRLTDGAGSWGPHQENTARLLEAQAYSLQLSWVDRTTDPDDPEVKRDRAEARRAGIEPPPRPMIPPTAYRPAKLAAQRLQEYLDEVSQYQVGGGRDRNLVTLDEFDAVFGIETEYA